MKRTPHAIRMSRAAPLLAGLALLGCAAVPFHDGREWQLAAAMPEPVQELYPAVLDGRIYVAGGVLNDGGDPSERFQHYDPAADRWTALRPLPQGRHHVTLSGVDGRLYAVGGFSGRFPAWRAQPTMWIYDPLTDRWSDGVDMPGPRGEGVAAVVAGRRIYWIGGRAPVTPDAAHFNDLADSALNQVFDPVTQRWSARAPAPTSRNSAATAVIDGRIYVVGGRRYARTDDGTPGANINVAALEVYDPATDTWDTKAPMPRAQSGLGAAAVDGILYACGGEQWVPDRTVMSDCWTYDPARDAWRSSPPLATPGHGIEMAAVDRRLHVFGGGTRTGGEFATALNQVLDLR